MADEKAVVLTAQFEELASKLIAVTNLTEREEMLAEMCALLEELCVLLKVGESDSEPPPA